MLRQGGLPAGGTFPDPSHQTDHNGASRALAVLVAAVLTGWGLHRTFDDHLEQRTATAGRDAVALAESAHRTAGGRWSADALDLLSHELVLTGYDYRLHASGRTLIDTTKLDRAGLDFRRVAALPVHGPDGDQVATLALYALGPGGTTPADEDLLHELDRGHLIAAAIAAIVAIGAGLIMAGRLSRPLRRLTAGRSSLARRRGSTSLLGTVGDAPYGATHLHVEIRQEWTPMNPHRDPAAVDPERA